MVLLEIQDIGVAIAELESDAPRSIYMNRKARWGVASQGVEVETWKIHIFWFGGGIQSIKPSEDPAVHSGVNSRLSSFPKRF